MKYYGASFREPRSCIKKEEPVNMDRVIAAFRRVIAQLRAENGKREEGS